MFSLFRRMTGSAATVTEPELIVDYDTDVKLPRGAEGISWDEPAGIGKVSYRKYQLIIERMPVGVTYREFKAQRPELIMADARALDALIGALFDKSGVLVESAAARYLSGFAGQIFFLGTGFFAANGVDHVAYLNWKTYQPATRYLCPADHPINHTVNCCACHIVA